MTSIPAQAIAQVMEPLLTGLLGIVERVPRTDPTKVAENDHVMRGNTMRRHHAAPGFGGGGGG